MSAFRPHLAWLLLMPCLGCVSRSNGPADESTAGQEDDAASTDEGGSSSSSGALDVCTPQLQPDGTPSGIDLCEPRRGWNRIEAVACSPSAELPPEDDGCLSSCMKYGGHGVCRWYLGEPFCHYECETDEDCGDEGACICAFDGMHSFNQCVSARCTTGADCPSGECGLNCFCDLVSGLVCRAPTDECAGDAQCNPPGYEPHCTYYGADEAFTCEPWVCGE